MTAFSIHARRLSLLLLAATLSQPALSATTQEANCEDGASASCATQAPVLLQTGLHGRQAALNMKAAAEPNVTAWDAAAEADAAEKAAASAVAEAKTAEDIAQKAQTIPEEEAAETTAETAAEAKVAVEAAEASKEAKEVEQKATKAIAEAQAAEKTAQANGQGQEAAEAAQATGEAVRPKQRAIRLPPWQRRQKMQWQVPQKASRERTPKKRQRS
ncbi:unnamed protein product [Polarella glacialis]|uniref:Uncharacterized protein n=1 Tax=Polarella glacialis TaxID=89957 RepID=A0A813M1M7_POLGL|nr:unnamed protein product [Polarella glacialis]